MDWMQAIRIINTAAKLVERSSDLTHWADDETGIVGFDIPGGKYQISLTYDENYDDGVFWVGIYDRDINDIDHIMVPVLATVDVLVADLLAEKIADAVAVLYSRYAA